MVSAFDDDLLVRDVPLRGRRLPERPAMDDHPDRQP
jgi:hypothetical protein